MYKISELCRESGLSRSTLLYYDKLGLLVPTERTGGNYREYSEEDRLKLEKICAFREAGVPLLEMRALLSERENEDAEILGKRLSEINGEIRKRRAQQRLIVEMLKAKGIENKEQFLSADVFVKILKSSGLGSEEMDKFHEQFEKTAPDAHQLFLEFLGIPKDEIQKLREDASEVKK